jgi:rubrerythrin
MISFQYPVRRAGGYVCRGCGTTIGSKGSYSKCPVCGIKWD